jgi:multicomponent Na+:H+ antiporter subunit G
VTVWLDAATVLLVSLGLLFFIAGTAGLLRFPDVFSRLHALTKADNLGLGLVAAGVALQNASWALWLKLLLIWLVVMLASATVCFLIARRALGDGVEPWRRRG